MVSPKISEVGNPECRSPRSLESLGYRMTDARCISRKHQVEILIANCSNYRKVEQIPTIWQTSQGQNSRSYFLSIKPAIAAALASPFWTSLREQVEYPRSRLNDFERIIRIVYYLTIRQPRRYDGDIEPLFYQPVRKRKAPLTCDRFQRREVATDEKYFHYVSDRVEKLSLTGQRIEYNGSAPGNTGAKKPRSGPGFSRVIQRYQPLPRDSIHSSRKLLRCSDRLG